MKTKVTLNRFFTFILIFALTIAQSMGQNYIDWQKTFSGTRDEHINKVIKTNDNGYLLLGYTVSKGAGAKDALVIKTDAQGNVVWERTYGEHTNEWASAAMFSDGGYIITGVKESSSSGEFSILVFKINMGGNLLWEKTIAGNGPVNVYGITRAVLDNGSVIIASTMNSNGRDLDTWIVKVNNLGRTVWQDKYAHQSLDDEAFGILAYSDGFVCAGYKYISGTNKNLFVIKYDLKGKVMWENHFGGDKEDYGLFIQQGEGNDAIICGTTESKGAGKKDFWLVCVDNNGRLKFDQTYGGAEDDIASAIFKTNDGYVIGGETKSKNDLNDNSWIIKTDLKGEKKWDFAFGKSGEKQSISDILSLGNNSFIVTGSIDVNNQKDGWAISLNNNLETAAFNQQKSVKNTLERPQTATIMEKGNAKISIIEPLIREGFKTTLEQPMMLIKGNVALSGSTINKILINGIPATVNADGSFSANLSLRNGNNAITVQAIDANNQISEKLFSVACTAGTAESTDDLSSLAGKYYAILIGVEEYNDPNINNLDFPIDDAERLHQTLTTYYTFEPDNVVLLKNPSYTEIISTFDNMSKVLNENDNLLIFYAGHGYWDEGTSLGYWLPSDALKTSTANWMRNSTLRDYISSFKAKHTLLIADACFSGGIFKTRSAFNTNEMALKKLYDLPSRKAMTSGALKEVPDQSAFLEYLNKRLENNDQKYMSSEVLFIETRPAVLNNSSNVPQYGTIKDTGDEGGEFIFIRR